jgi:pyridoxine/pyridoxamine 5'-phosphate oxidase
VPDVVVEFQLEAQSVEFLRQRVHRLHTEHLPDRVDAVA